MPPQRPAVQLPRAARARLVALTAFLLVSLGARPGSDLPLPRPAPQQRAADYDAAAENDACTSCHQEIAEEWRGSLHRQSFSHPVFAAAHRAEPSPFCRGCHAPEADPATTSGGARHIGVACVTCHVQHGDVVGPRELAASAGHHRVIGDPRMATGAACASCHQFDFPTPQRAAMQDTLGEHASSSHASKSCQDCHMPLVLGSDGTHHRSHDFGVAGRPEKLRAAITASARRDGALAITVTLANTGAGHAVPTGDMFRRLEVRAWSADDPELAAKPVVLARRFARGGAEGALRQQVGDDRLAASGAPRDVWLPFGDSVQDHTLRWEVAYQRMDPSMADAFGLDPASLEVIVASGELTP